MDITSIVGSLLFKLHIINYSVEELYTSFFSREISADGIYLCLRPKQVEKFIELHSRVKALFDGEDSGLPPVILFQLSSFLVENPGRFASSIAQVDTLIERDIEKNIFRRNNRKNIVSREM